MMPYIMQGNTSEAQNGAFITALRLAGETSTSSFASFFILIRGPNPVCF
jgi:anthranilate phosphoribosyltransferase